MQQSRQDELNAPSHDTNEGRSPRHQTIARLAETVQNYLTQLEADSPSPNPSSDPRNAPQNHEQNYLQLPRIQQKVPHEFGCEHQNQISQPEPPASQNEQPFTGDHDSEPPVLSQSLGQPRGDSDSFKTAGGQENQGANVEMKAQFTYQNQTIQSVWSTADAADKNVISSLSNLQTNVVNGAITTPFPEAVEHEARYQRENLSSLQFELDGKVVSNECQFEIKAAVVSNPETIIAKHLKIASEEIQSVEIDQPDDIQQDSFDEKEAHQSGRVVRQCVKNTPNYSHTHKGTASSAAKHVTPFDAEMKDKIEVKDGDSALDRGQNINGDERKTASLDNKNKAAGKRSYEEISCSYQSMFAFDWELRDINNLRHPPDREVTAVVVWFYINMLYFPYNAQDYAQVPFEEFARPIFESLENVDHTIRFAQEMFGCAELQLPDRQEQANTLSQGEMLVDEDEAQPNDPFPVDMIQGTHFSQVEDIPMRKEPVESGYPELVQKLSIEEHFFEFRDMFRENLRLIKEQLRDEAQVVCDDDADFDLSEDSLANLLPENQQERDETLFDMLLKKVQEDLEKLRKTNKSELKRQYSKFTNAYIEAEKNANLIIKEGPNAVARPNQAYNPTKLEEYGLDFLSFVDPHYVADIKQNREWYLQNQNEVLLNVSYPSKQEKEFLRHIEQWQQEKNDLNYKRILQQLAEGADDPNCDGPNGLNIQRYNSLSAHKRGLVVQEDAQCAICNNGDYEDEDLIVFCGACNIPVHQRCYGIDEIPDNDWICNNCWAFNMRRGIMVKCILCPKRGGAMKPTSIFRTYEHYMNYHTAAQKKKGLQHQNYFANYEGKKPQETLTMENELQTENIGETDQQNVLSQQNLQVVKQGSSSRNQRLEFFEREDKNHALSQILSREGNFQEALIIKTKAAGEIFPQNNVELHFLESESIAEIPEDYTFFLQRNEQRLESSDTVMTETLYEWVHLSCAMWIPGPNVTPKTPVRMSKIDIKRFDLQCIICGKRNCGACIQCQHSRCMISFHIECARRANYFLEVERVERERSYRVFCEKHRPLKIVREMEEKDKQTLEEVQKFSKVIDRCMEIHARAEVKLNRQKRLQPFSKPPAPELSTKRDLISHQKQQKASQRKQQKQIQDFEKLVKKEQERLKKEQQRAEKEIQRRQRVEAAQKAIQKKVSQQVAKQETKTQTLPKYEPVAKVPFKWSSKDIKTLYERVRDKFLQIFKLRVNVLRVDPMIKIKKKQDMILKKNEKEVRRVEKKRREKQNKKMLSQIQKGIMLSGGQRSGLRSRSNVNPGDGLQQSDETGQIDMSLQHLNNNESQGLILENPEQNDYQRRKDDLNIETNGDLKQDSESYENVSRRPTIEDLLPSDEVDPYYKFCTPQYMQELDWAITFSKYDFPWHDVKFLKISAKECYKKYTGTIRDVQTFYKKVLGGKEKLKKHIASQLNEPARVFFGSNAEDGQNLNNAQSAEFEAQQAGEEAAESDVELFCKCKGEYQSLTGYFVMCEAENDCVNGGWLHPECTRDLYHLTQEEIMKLDKWYCEDCMDRMNITDQPHSNSSFTKPQKNSIETQRQSKQHSEQSKKVSKSKRKSSNPKPERATITEAVVNDLSEPPLKKQRTEQFSSITSSIVPIFNGLTLQAILKPTLPQQSLTAIVQQSPSLPDTVNTSFIQQVIAQCAQKSNSVSADQEELRQASYQSILSSVMKPTLQTSLNHIEVQSLQLQAALVATQVSVNRQQVSDVQREAPSSRVTLNLGGGFGFSTNAQQSRRE